MITSRVFDENERLQELLSYNILDSPDEQDFNDVVKLASFLCNASIGLVTLVDDCRQWFKAKTGWDYRETPRDVSFCAHTIHQEGTMQVKDTLRDERFSKNPLVLEGPKVRFYAGVPLVSPRGFKLGTLCVLDQQPRSLTEKQEFGLQVLAKYIIQLLELRSKQQSLVSSQREHELLRQNMQLQQRALNRAQRAARIGMFEHDLRTDKMRITAGLCQLFGMKLTQVIDANVCIGLIHPEDLPGYLKYFELLFGGRSKRFSYDFRCFRKNTKKEIYVRSTGEIVRNEKGDAVQLIGIKQDISQQKNYEKQLEQQNAMLLKVNQELDNFVYRVSHDLRAPISSLLGLVAIMSNEHEVDKIKELLLLAKKTLEKQDKFIKDILDYSRNSRQELQLHEVSLEEVLADIFSQFSLPAQQAKLEYSFEVAQDVPFVTDLYRLQIVLNNLISNAFKYLKQGKEDSFIKVKVTADARQAVFVIEDNGIGIGRKHLSRVFDMFYRATDYHSGSGLGLYIVKETVAKLKGEISIESEAGQGTQVKLCLPNFG